MPGLEPYFTVNCSQYEVDAQRRDGCFQVVDLAPFWDQATDRRTVALRNLESFWRQPNRSDASGALKAWFAEAKVARWTPPQHVKNQCANANTIANNRVVFHTKGNNYRLVVAIAYRMQYIYVKFIGTHAEYDKVDAAVVNHCKGVL